jgi:type IV pilus assembly protein PilV
MSEVKQMHSNKCSMPARQRGVGMIEVLIALLVFSIGMLGLTSMQLTAKRTGYEASQRSIATSLARDILERMRANPDQLTAYVVSDLGGSTVTAAVNCNTADCDPAQLAQRDLLEWSNLLLGAAETLTLSGATNNAGGLVDARACITHNNGNVAVAIAWHGVAEMTNPAESDCGEASGLYGTGNVQRRLLVMSTYIGAV